MVSLPLFSDLLFEQATLIADKAGLPWYAKPDVLRYYREKDQAKAFYDPAGDSCSPEHPPVQRLF